MEKNWWKESVVYEIYPRSFYDSNKDGIGDLEGIRQKLPYLKELGVDILWLCPIYESPNDDNGYDVSDYQKIMTVFGTMEDFERLLEQAHQMGLKIMMDMVLNHTSDEHVWFVNSRKSRDNPYRDFYIWREGKEGKEPNNWNSLFGGSAWEYDSHTEMYYLHLFSKKQPDLNWENDKVREEIYQMMNWWCSKGIDGIRLDVISDISKKPGLPDKEFAKDVSPYCHGPRVHEFLREMNRKVLSKYELCTVGQTDDVTTVEALQYAGYDRRELDMVFQYELDSFGNDGPYGKWNDEKIPLRILKNIVTRWQTELEGKGWNTLCLESHDSPRAVTRYGDDKRYRCESAKMLATCFYTLQGTPFLFQGQELGATNARFSSLSDYKDVEVGNFYRELVDTGKLTEERFLELVQFRGRDNVRTPMQWDSGKHAGFTEGTPWLKVNPNYREINILDQRKDPDSVYSYYKELLALRKRYDVWIYGKYEVLEEDHPYIFMYTRTLAEEQLLVICNFTDQKVSVMIPKEYRKDFLKNRLLIGNYKVSKDEIGVNSESGSAVEKEFLFRPYEARVYWREMDEITRNEQDDLR